MSLKIGIVGLPNVGKSTIFNALTKTKNAQAANYPFCTIDPNVGIVNVPDLRINKLADISNSENKIPAIIEFVDIAGLVKGASQGEGLGNKFLSHVRECHAIAHVLRHFEDSNISHVHGEIDPKFDREIIESELLLADIQTMERRLQKAQIEAKSHEKDKKIYADLLEYIKEQLEKGVLAYNVDLEPEQLHLLKELNLLTLKPNLYIANIHENYLRDFDKEKYANALGIEHAHKIIPISARIEEDLSDFSPEEATEYLKSLSIEEPGLNSLIRSAYSTLGLHTFFTSGPKETRAWTIKTDTKAPQAAGTIHTDFEKGFIKAEVVNWEDFVNAGGESKAREKGLIRMEGKDYLVKDGDVIHFKFAT